MIEVRERDDVTPICPHCSSAAGEIWFLAPADLALEQSDRFDPPPRERIQLVEHHLTATSRAAREQTFVTALRPYRVDEQPPPAPTLEPVAGPNGSCDGAFTS